MANKLSVDNFTLDSNNNFYMIAEIGLNHNNDIDLTKRMILKAKESGANAVKFQTYNTEKLLPESSPAFSIFKKLELSKVDFLEISAFCKKSDITFFSTPFCFESVDLLEEINVPCYKIASMDVNYYDFIRYIASKNKPVIISTGMSKLSEICRAIETIEKTGNKQIIIMHCISKYPPSSDEMNMRMISQLIDMYPDYPIGFSDHSPSDTMAIVARVLGACVFEKHFTMDKNLDGPDHKISFDPYEFKTMKDKLLSVDESLNFSAERKDMDIAIHAKRSLFAGKNLKKGELLEKNMIDVIRPGNGLPPEMMEFFLGKEIKKDLKKGQIIDFSII
jgi:N,N'-diacetyllegionaminate synthase